tara:strand:+ start:278 stop:1684 length:1407 start_codon:yes stop_codon:yes gene_type:complete
MKLLSPKLQSEIKASPTDTVLRSENIFEDQTNIRLLKSVDLERHGINIPESFNGRKVWGELITPPKNQGSCGGCWAFASTGTLADKFNIQSLGLMNIDLSPAKLILCDKQGKELSVKHPEKNPELVAKTDVEGRLQSACYGNSLYDAWRYLYIKGTNTSKCVPYNQTYGKYSNLTKLGSFDDPYKMPTCSGVTGILGDMCVDFTIDINTGEEIGTPARFYRAIHFYAIAGIPKDGGTEKNIRHNIFVWGPVSSGMKVYPDFYTFDAKNEIYKWNGEGPQVGGHAVEIVGWGIENNTKYWLIKNSWGTEWGDGGYFKMIRGINNCELEENVFTGIPDYFFPLEHKVLQDYRWIETPKMIQQRKDLDVSPRQNAGGIDPATGYTRRIKNTKPWTYFNLPVELNDLPDNDTFIAGIDATLENRIIYQNKIKSKYNNIIYTNNNLYMIIIIICFLIAILTIATFIYFKQIKR